MKLAVEISQLIVAGTAFIAILFAAWELRMHARRAGQTHAREAWMKYLELGLQYPELGSDELAMRHYKVRKVEDLFDDTSAERDRYLWFRDIMLEACESLVKYFPTNSWRNTIKFNLRLHKRALQNRWDDEGMYWSRELCDIVQEVLNEGSGVEDSHGNSEHRTSSKGVPTLTSTE